MNSRIWIGFWLANFGFLGLGAQDLKKSGEDTEDQVEVSVEAAGPASGLLFELERKNLLNLLTTEVEPKLPTKDVEKLHRSVQRLGSYRSDWAQSAKELLVSNAAVAELVLYRYSYFKNARLNAKIMETLLSFESFRNPRAALAFAETLGLNPQLKAKVLQLLERAINQDPSLAPDSLRLLESDWAQDLPNELKLRLIQKSCSVWPRMAPQVAASTVRWSSDSQSFWLKLLSQEVSSCLKGL